MNDYITIPFGIFFKIVVSTIPMYLATVYTLGLLALSWDTFIQINVKEFEWGLFIFSVIRLLTLPLIIILFPVINYSFDLKQNH